MVIRNQRSVSSTFSDAGESPDSDSTDGNTSDESLSLHNNFNTNDGGSNGGSTTTEPETLPEEAEDQTQDTNREEIEIKE